MKQVVLVLAYLLPNIALAQQMVPKGSWVLETSTGQIIAPFNSADDCSAGYRRIVQQNTASLNQDVDAMDAAGLRRQNTPLGPDTYPARMAAEEAMNQVRLDEQILAALGSAVCLQQ